MTTTPTLPHFRFSAARAFCGGLLVLVFLLTTLNPAVAQQASLGGEISVGELLREDGTLDLNRAHQGTVDLSGFALTLDDDGELRARADGEAQWLPGEGHPGTNRTIQALAWGPDGSLYVGGWFTSAGGVPASHIARWTPDGSEGTWSALGSGVNDYVFALAWGPGGLYVGGAFTSASGVPGTNHIARWTPIGTGGTWGALDAGVNERVFALAWRPGGGAPALYVGGRFTSASGANARHIARWSPSGSVGTWTRVSTDGVSFDNDVYALVWGTDNALYVGGNFTSSAGTGMNRIARWMPGVGGGQWSALGQGVDSSVSALAWGPDGALYVGGWFSTAYGTDDTSRIARWTPEGSSGAWSPLGTGIGGTVSTRSVRSIVWGPDGALYAGGFGSWDADGIVLNRIARWTPNGNEGTWSTLGSGVGSWEVSALTWSPNGALFAGGSFATAGDEPAVNNIARWTPDGDEGTWSPLNTEGLSNMVRAFAWGPDGALYVGGEFTRAGGVEGTSRVARWTPSESGGSWSALGSGVDAVAQDLLVVNALTWSPAGDLYVGGFFDSAGGVDASHIARWTPDGTPVGGAWSPIGAGVNGTVHDVTWGPDGALYVGGDFTVAGGVTGTRGIARWTPTSGAWSALGTGLGNTAFAITWGPDGALYLGGVFRQAGGTSGFDRIARWTPDGTPTGGAWSTLGTGMNRGIFALAWGGGDLYAGGAFQTAGGAAATKIARWTPDGEGGAWSSMRAGIESNDGDGDVMALAWGSDDALYVGGEFLSAVGAPFTNMIARWTPDGAGGSWSSVGMGMDVGFQVTALAVGPDNVMNVGGDFITAGGNTSSYFARWGSPAPPVSVENEDLAPFELRSNYPNPFSSETTVSYSLTQAGEVRLVVYDILGREVARLADGLQAAGEHEVVWPAGSLASGSYLIRLTTGSHAQTRRALILR